MAPRVDLTAFADKIQQLRDTIAQTIVGQTEAIDLILTTILADGHVLLEGVPGVAKTLMARLMARLVDARFNRIQFTPDLMPSDVLGTTVFNMKTSEFSFHEGPAFADIILVDEINRAPAKTQAALFEVMEERQVSIDGTTRKMGPVYTIIATQNPVEQEVTIGYPTAEQEVDILNRHQRNARLTKLDDVNPIITQDELLKMRAMLGAVLVEDSLVRYIVQIVQQTRQSRAVFLGASPRAAVAMLQASKAYAMLQGRDFVTPDDIKAVTPSILQHRLLLTAEAEMQGYNALSVTQSLIDKVEVPK